ncbi:MAG: hypothetical protein KC619_26620 [Myxococcales bacterium]|nr:hypothetical protein [Myxococcales bacterium]
MPLTLTLTEGVLPEDKIDEAIARISAAMLRWHRLEGNAVMTPNVTANVHVVPKGRSYSGGKAFQAAWIEWKVPSFAFADREVQRGFGEEATNIVHELSGGEQPRDHIYFNVVHTVDGSWNLDGVAMSNEELLGAIGKG